MEVNRRAQTSIATQLIRLVFALYCVVAILITLIQILLEYQHTEKTIKQELTLNQPIFGPVLSSSVWDLDVLQMQNTLNGMLAAPIVTGVKITQEGKLLAATGVVEHNARLAEFDQHGVEDLSIYNLQAPSIRFSFDIRYQFRQQQRTIGQVTVYSNSSVVLDRVEMGIILLVINSVLKTIALWLLFYYVGRRILVRPLNRLLHSINRVDLAHLEKFEIDLKSQGNNEFAVIQTAFSDMVANLHSTKIQLLDIQQHLEHKVEQRTEDLYRAKEQAQHANEAKSQFMSRISHELNTPLNAILCSAQLLETATKMKEEEKQYVANIKTAGRHLHVLIQDIMDIVQNESGQLQIELMPCDLPALTKECIDMMMQPAFDKSVHLSFVPHPASVLGNPDRIKQVLLKLIDNAIKFNHRQGSVTLSITHDDDNHISLAIADTGKGLDATELEALFTPMSRLETEGHDGLDGMGLGLAIVKLLLERMNASIRVDSDGVHGCVFTLRFKTCD